MPVGEEKDKLLRGNYVLAADMVFEWYRERDDYISARGAPNREEVYTGEIDEYQQAKHKHWDELRERRTQLQKKPWRDDQRWKEIWDIASEAADIAIVGASELQKLGASEEWIFQLWQGKYDNELFFDWLKKYRDDLITVKHDLQELGVDLAEAIITKTTLNAQHYEKAFFPWVFLHKIGLDNTAGTFARKMRRNIGGDGSSQMPDLMMSRLGELSLSRAQCSPFGSNGNGPKAIWINQNSVEVAPRDDTQTYQSLYMAGPIAWSFDIAGIHRFHHEAEQADYRWYYTQPGWRKAIDGLRSAGIKRIVVPSGSNFRFHGLLQLARFMGMEFEKLVEVDDEWRWGGYLDMCKEKGENADFAEYQLFNAMAKQNRLRDWHGDVGRQYAQEGIVLAMDEVILWWDDTANKYVPWEKPKNLEEASQQIHQLVQGRQYFISNMTVVGSADIAGYGEANALQIIPMRIKCDSLEEQTKLEEHWLNLYRQAVGGQSRWKVTPGGVSMLHPDLQPYQAITLPEGGIKDTVFPFEGVEPYGHKLAVSTFISQLAERGVEQNYLDLTEKDQNEIGIAVGGLSLVGLREAIQRYLIIKNWSGGQRISLDKRRVKKLELLKI